MHIIFLNSVSIIIFNRNNSPPTCRNFSFLHWWRVHWREDGANLSFTWHHRKANHNNPTIQSIPNDKIKSHPTFFLVREAVLHGYPS